MPSATPISRTVELVPLALALSSGRMLASTAVDEGANTRPMPIPAEMNAGSMVAYGTVADMFRPSQNNPAAWNSSPATISVRVPIRPAKMPARGATTIGAIVQGVVSTAACSAEFPCTICRN